MSSVAKKLTLGKNERLKSRKQIEQLFSKGKSFSVTPLRAYYLFDHRQWTLNNGLRFGVGVSGKNFRKAVERNRIKRLVKEATRLQKNELLEKLKEKNVSMNVFFIYTGRELPEYKLVFSKVGVILNKLVKLVDENAFTNS